MALNTVESINESIYFMKVVLAQCFRFKDAAIMQTLDTAFSPRLLGSDTTPIYTRPESLYRYAHDLVTMFSTVV